MAALGASPVPPRRRNGGDGVIMNPIWLVELEELSHRYPETGVVNDLPNLDLGELWGAFQFLRRIDESHGEEKETH